VHFSSSISLTIQYSIYPPAKYSFWSFSFHLSDFAIQEVYLSVFAPTTLQVNRDYALSLNFSQPHQMRGWDDPTDAADVSTTGFPFLPSPDFLSSYCFRTPTQHDADQHNKARTAPY
jgi:hypothetical protein